MAFNYWSDDEEEFTGEYVQEGGGDFPVIPHETRVMALIDKAEWLTKKNFKDEGNEQKCISLRFDVEDGEFKGQKIFKKFFIDKNNGNGEQARKDYKLFMNIDVLAGRKISSLDYDPDEEELQKYLINKSMVIIVGLFTDKDTRKEKNYLMGVSGGNSKVASKPNASAPKASATVAKKAVQKMELDDSDDIPF